jgi:hypothetical protein
MEYEELLLCLGMVTGALCRPENERQLIESIAHDRLDGRRVTWLRDRLTAILKAAEPDPEPEAPSP